MADAHPIYWVEASLPGRLAIVARPRGRADFATMKAAGIDVLASLLEPEEAALVGLADEAGACARAGIAFVHLPVTDHGIPRSFPEMEAAIASFADHLGAGRGVAAHCYAGLGRSPLLVAGILVHYGHSSDGAIRLVSEARGYRVPEMRSQHAWLRELAERRAAR
jgi:protein-tyrosine phosphatase